MMASPNVKEMSPPELELFKQQTEKSLAGFRKMKTEGQRRVVRFEVVFGSNGILKTIEQVGNLETAKGSVPGEKSSSRTWILEQPDKRVAFDESQDSVRVDSDPLSSSTGSELGDPIHLMGGLGRVGELADIDTGKKDILKRGGKLTIFDAYRVESAVDWIERVHPELAGGLGVYSSPRFATPYCHIDARGENVNW